MHCVVNKTFLNELRSGSSSCPTSDWLESVAALMPAPEAPTYVNIGANKGYSTLEFLSLWTAHRVSGVQWKREVIGFHGGGDTLKMRACGNCNDCRRPLPSPHGRRGGTAHLLEMTAGNRGLLRHVLNSTGLADSTVVHDLAASNASGVMRVPRTVVGDERLGLCLGAAANCAEEVRVVSVDDFMAEQRLRVAWLISIDTEGHDALVIEGARRTLAERRVALLQFEVNGVGYWASARRFGRSAGRHGTPPAHERRSLRGVIEALEGWGYHCFWETTTAGMVPLSSACWDDGFERRSRTFWANVACAHEPRVLATMRSFTGVPVTDPRASRNAAPARELCLGVAATRLGKGKALWRGSAQAAQPANRGKGK